MHKENGCRYKLDVEKVCFNPHLAIERNRVASVGSFSQIAKRALKATLPQLTSSRCGEVRTIEAIEGDIREIYVFII